MSEVKDSMSLQPGDQVEFVLVTNQRTGKSSACNVTKVRWALQIGTDIPSIIEFWYSIFFIFKHIPFGSEWIQFKHLFFILYYWLGSFI